MTTALWVLISNGEFMTDISEFKGPGQFGPAYQIMFENDSHASGSIDRELMENMILLNSETENYIYTELTPTISHYKEGARPLLEEHVKRMTSECHSEQERIEAIAGFTGSMQNRASDDLDLIRIGGTEEEMITRGSDWCSDVARVACALYQIAGVPARMVYLIDTEKAYTGHVIIEVYRSGVWGALDPLTNVIYNTLEGKPASTWNLMNDPRLIERHSRDGSTYYTNAGQFRAAAVSNYFIWDWEKYDYTVSKVNGYYRSILEMSDKGWPDGLHWINNEDSSI